MGSDEGDEGGCGNGHARRNREPQHPPDETCHEPAVIGGQRQEEARDADGQGVDDREMAREKGIGQQERTGGQSQSRRPDCLGQEHVGHPLDVGGDPAAFGDDRGDLVEAIVEKNDLGDRPRRLSSAAHGDPDVGELQCEHIVDAVTGHGDGVALRLERLHHCPLLIRSHPTEDRPLVEQPAQGNRVVRELPRVDRHLCARHTCSGSHRPDRERTVPGQHLECHALLSEVRNRGGRLGSELLGQDHECGKFQVGRQTVTVDR